MPESMPNLVARVPQTKDRGIVFAKRARRSENIGFKLMYQAFKVFHRIFVGRRVEVGNFSAMSHGVLERLMGVPETGNQLRGRRREVPNSGHKGTHPARS